MVKAGVRGAASGAVYQGLWNYGVGSGAGRSLYNSKGDLSPGKAQKKSAKPEIVKHTEVKAPTQINASEVTNRWDNFLGKMQTNRNPYTGKIDPNRIFSMDGTKSIRFGQHEMNSMLTTKFHFHEEKWVYDSMDNIVNYYNTLVRIK